MKAVVITAGFLATWSLAVAGCNRTDATEQPANAVTPMAEQDQQDQLETYVRARFQSDATVRTYDVDVTADNGRITLRGTVPSEEARQQVVQAAQGVSGVQSVDDQLTVGNPRPTVPPSAGSMARAADSREPGWITTKIRAQYWVNPEIRPWNIDVNTSSNGVVTLRGEVEEAADRDEAVRIARSTEGVTDVQDRLTIGGERNDRDDRNTRNDTANQPDAWVTAKIQAQYFVDTDVKGRDINVDTNDGVVTLRGTVDSDAQRRQALTIARNTDGVRSVNDQLTIGATGNDRNNANDRNNTARAATTIEDTWITTKLQSKYFLDPQIKGTTIDVTTRSGVVTLQGSVASSDLKEQAEQIAMETDGVTRVDNQLKIATTTR